MGRTRPARGDKLRFAVEVGVTPDEVRRAVEDALVRAPVVSERQAPPGKARADVLDLRVTPSIDRLFRIADDGDVAEVLGRGQPDEIELDPVGVLELVDDEVAESLATAAAEFGHALQCFDHPEEQVVEVAQSLSVQSVLVCAIYGEEDIDRLALSERRVRATGAIRRGAAAPVLGVEVERSLLKSFWADAATFELEQEAQSRTKEVIEVVHRQRGEGVRVERRGGAAAQLRHQLL